MDLEGKADGICGGNLGSRRACAIQETLGYSPRISLQSHPKSGASWSFKSHGLMPLV